jgi:hypothetical protein
MGQILLNVQAKTVKVVIDQTPIKTVSEIPSGVVSSAIYPPTEVPPADSRTSRVDDNLLPLAAFARSCFRRA